MPLKTIGCLAALLLASAAAPAQDVVRLKNGKTVAGKARDGMLAVDVETAAGRVRIPWRGIERIDRAASLQEEYRKRRSRIARDDATGHFLLALWCRKMGLAREMKTHLERVLEIDPDHRGARSALGFEKVSDRWVAGEEALAAKGFVRRGGRWVLAEEAEYEDLVRSRERPLSGDERKASDLIRKAADENPRVAKYARTALAALPWEAVRKPLYRALGRSDAGIRAFAARELGRRKVEEAARPLIRTALLDTKPEVRAVAVRALREIDRPDALFPLVRVLGSSRPAIRMNAARAVAGFGDVRGVEYLVTRLAQNWGPSTRVNLQVLRQISYIRDFDVEIAQASQIGDPIVGILQEGVVLDVRVLGANRKMTLVERRVLRNALRDLTGVDQGDRPEAWAAWWKRNKTRLLAARK